jgi:uncharacterized protein (DUF433 family)
MVSARSASALGIGLYTPVQAAHIARMAPRTMQRWIHGTKEGQSVVRSQLPPEARLCVTFLDLVQAMAIRAIRLEKNIPLSKLREFIDRAESHYGVTHPFAREHQTYLFDDDIVLRHGDHLIQLTGRYKDQDLIRPVAELYMLDIAFTDGLASQYTPLRDDQRSIVIDPRKRMGQPIVMPCGYSVQSLVDSVRAEGSPQEAARINKVGVDDILIAMKYEDVLRGVAA